MYPSRVIDLSGRSPSHGVGVVGVSGEDRRALMERTRVERAERARRAEQGSQAQRIQRAVRRWMEREKARREVRAMFDTEWNAYTHTLNQRMAALKENPSLDALLFPTEAPQLSRLIGLLHLSHSRHPVSHAIKPSIRTRSKRISKCRQTMHDADDLKLLSLAAAIVKGSMQLGHGDSVCDAAGAARHNFLAAYEQPFFVLRAQYLTLMLLDRLEREFHKDSIQDTKSAALLLSCFCTILDTSRWMGIQKADLTPTPTSPASPNTASPTSSPPSSSTRYAIPTSSMAIGYRQLIQMLIQHQLFQRLRNVIFNVRSPSPTKSASSTTTSSAAAAAAAATLSQPSSFATALMTASLRVVELCISPPPRDDSASVTFIPPSVLLIEPLFLFAAYILTIPACHLMFNPSHIKILAAVPSTRSTALPIISMTLAAIHQVMHDTVHATDDAGSLATTVHPALHLQPQQRMSIRRMMPHWVRDSSNSVRTSSLHHDRSDGAYFNVPPPVHLLTTLLAISARQSGAIWPLHSLSSTDLTIMLDVWGSLIRQLPPTLFLIRSSGHLEVDTESDDGASASSPPSSLSSSIDNSPQALAVRADILRQLASLSHLHTLRTIIDRIFIEGDELLRQREEEGNCRTFSIPASHESIASQLRSYSLIHASPSTNDRFLARFSVFRQEHPHYFSSVLRFLKSFNQLRSNGMEFVSSHGSGTGFTSDSPLLRQQSLSWLSFSSPFILGVWSEIQRRVGCELSEQTSSEQHIHIPSSDASSSPSKSTSAASAIKFFFGFKSSSSSESKVMYVTNRNRWEMAILTSRSSSDSSDDQSTDVTVCDLFVLWLTTFSPLLFILDDEELLQHFPSLSPPRVSTLISLVHLLKTIVFRLIWNKYERQLGGETSVDADAHEDLLTPAQVVLKELYHRDSRRPFMHLGTQQHDAGKEHKKPKKKDERSGGNTGYAVLPVEMDVMSENTASSSPSSSSSFPPPSVEARAQHWLLSSGGGLANMREMNAFEHAFQAWQHGSTSSVDGSSSSGSSADTFDPSTPHGQRMMHLLRDMPFILSFPRRVELLRACMRADARQHGYDASSMHHLAGVELVIRRDHLVEDGLHAVARLGRRFKQRLRIKFIESGSVSEAERGIDLGGIFKEFLEGMLQELCKLDYGLWARTPIRSNGEGGEYYPSPLAPAIHPDYYDLLQCVGRIIGKALYEGILLDIPFAPFFLYRFIGQPCVLADLRTMDEQLYDNLMFIKHYDGDVSDLSLSFAVSKDEIAGGGSDSPEALIELIPGGASIDVTNANRTLYIYRLAHYHLNMKLSRVIEPFMSGVSEMIELRWFHIFNAAEMRMIISGSSTRSIDVQDWKKYTKYEECRANAREVHWFWELLESGRFSDAEKAQLLKFTTSCSRPPLQGFRELNPPFCIRLVPANEEAHAAGFFKRLFSSNKTQARLPSAATCFNTLKLPKYSSKRVLEEKLKVAIQNNVGFHLV